MRFLRADAEAAHLLENLVSCFGPLERFASFVVSVDVVADRLAKLRNARVRAALKRVSAQQPEETLDEVQPRGVRRREVENKAWVTK